MMSDECKFCKEENMTENSFFRPFKKHDDYIFHDKHGFHINVFCGCGDYTELNEIHYCPYCGKELKEDE